MTKSHSGAERLSWPASQHHHQGTWALPIAVLVGKPAGILLGAGVAVLAGLRLPHHGSWRDLSVIGCGAARLLGVGRFAR